MNASEFVKRETVHSWGGVVKAPCWTATPQHRDEAVSALAEPRRDGETVLAMGLGRSYGDSGLNPDHRLIDMTAMDRLMAFDPETGVLRVEAGASLWDVIAFAAPRGFFLPTTPGTRFVTIGGAIANDVHGKNHHSAGAFGRHVKRLCLLRSDLGVVEISPETDGELFAATVGGLGLTGLILWADIALVRVPSMRIRQEVTPFANLDAFFDLAQGDVGKAEHTVAWVDCLASGDTLGRGVFTSGDWAEDGDRTARAKPNGPTIIVDAPSALLNNLTLRAFNTVYYRWKGRGPKEHIVSYDGFFYPLDGINRWNRLYGKRGFYQHQSVVPAAVARDATREMLSIISAAGAGSFLAVLKTFGPLDSPGLLSFPMEGATLALDFPNHGEKTLRLLDTLDGVVKQAGGRIYPAKDGRMSREIFESGYANLDRFVERIDPAFSSGFWRRMGSHV